MTTPTGETCGATTDGSLHPDAHGNEPLEYDHTSEDAQ